MRRVLALVGVVLWSVSSASAAPFVAVTSFDLNRSGVLERLRTSNPAHYEKIAKILDGLTQRPYDDVPRWINASFDAKYVNYSPVLMTSYPAQRDLTFTLDFTRYRARITLTSRGAVVLPSWQRPR